ncbi:MAG TPA: tetratricopeptide repeat protein, partial [Pyrinomonadaceae bacterium]
MKDLKFKMKSSFLLQTLTFVFPLLLTMNAAFGQTISIETRELKFGKSVERKIKTGEPHEYKLSLRSGQNLFVELEEQIFDVKIELVKADDKKTVAETNLGGGYDRENLIFAAQETGEYLLRVSAAENQFGNGGYRLAARLADALNETDKTRVEALRLLTEAAALQKESTAVKIREAIAKREQALALWQKIGDKYWEGRTLDRLGSAHNSLLENNKAVEYLDRALQIVKESGDKLLEAATLNTVGSMTNGFGEHQKAIEYHNQALSLFQAEKNKLGIAATIFFIGDAYNGLEEKTKAVEQFQAGLKLAKELKNNDWEAQFLNSLGLMADAMNEKPKALNLFNQSLSTWSVKNLNGRAGTLLNTGKTYISQNEPDKALDNFNQALALYKSSKTRGSEISTLWQIAMAYEKKRDREAAIKNFMPVLSYYREFNLAVAEIIVLNSIVLNYELSGKYKEAVEYAEMCLKAAEFVPEKTSEKRKDLWLGLMKQAKALILMTLGRISENTGNFDKALEYNEKALSFFETKNTKDFRQMASVNLGAIAQIYRFKYKYDKTLEYHLRSLKMAEEDGDKPNIARRQNSVGLIYGFIGDKTKELEFYEKSVATFRSLENPDVFEKSTESVVLSNIGRVYLNSGKPDKAREYYNQALKIQEKITDINYIDQKAGILTKLASLHAYLGENQKAIEVYKEALGLFRKAPDNVKRLSRNRVSEADILNGLANVYSSLGDNRQALEKYNEAFQIALNAKEDEFAAITLNNIATVNFEIGERQKALEQFAQVLQFSRDVNNRTLEMEALGRLGITYSVLMDKQKAIANYSQALAIARDISDKKQQATYLNLLSVAYGYLSKNEIAFQHVNQSLQIFQEIGDKDGIATTFNNTAILYSSIGERGKALELYEQALVISREIKDKSSESTYLGNIAYDYVGLGEYQSALEHLEKSLSISRESGFKRNQANCLIGIGDIYFELGKKEKNRDLFTKGLNYYEEALKLSRESQHKDGEASSLAGIGRIYVEMGETSKALPYLNDSLQLSRKHQSKFQEDTTYIMLGNLHEKNGALDEAAAAYEQALTLARTINDKDIEARALKCLMRLWKLKKNNHLAIFYGKQAVNKYQEMRGSIRNLKRETQDVFRDKITDVYRELADLLIEAKRLDTAEKVLAMLKQQEAFDFIRRDAGEAKDLLTKRVGFSDEEAKSIAEYVRLADELIAKSQRKSELENNLNLSEKEKEELKKLTLQVDEANAGIKLFFKKLAAEFTKETEEEETITAKTLESLQDDLQKAGKGVVLVSTYLLPERYRAVITTGNARVDRKTEYKTLNLDGKAVNEKIRDFKRALQNPKIDPRPLGKELYDIFIKPL